MKLSGGLTIVSNREPYVHERTEDGIEASRPSGGLTASLDSVMGRLGGRWIAWGSGDADLAVTDEDGIVEVPPDDPAYDLHRVALTDEQVQGYYKGYSNQMLWPLMHLHVDRIGVEGGDWRAYREVNERFAEAVLSDLTDTGAVWFQDYHLALAPRTVRDRADDPPPLVHFWHIPWPPADVFRLCPHAEKLLDGLLANDYVGFHVARYREHFLESVAALLPRAEVDRERGVVRHDGHETTVYVNPLGVDPDAVREASESDEARAFRRRLREAVPDDTAIIAGVERLDYTKGVVNRLRALESLFESHPEHRGELTYVGKATTTRETIPVYRRYHDDVLEAVERINDRFGTDDWQPVIHHEEWLSERELAGLYREADLCLVTPRQDGMNLVAKEFVAASEGTSSVLLLSEFAGAHEALGHAAVSVNPFDVDGMVRKIRRGLWMSEQERRERMVRLSRRVRQEDIDAWIGGQFAVTGRRPEAPLRP